MEIEETQLPGVGVRHDFMTRDGERVGVISHRTGRRELLLYDRGDPDATRHVVRLEDEDALTLAELLGATHVTERLTELQHVEGLTIDWLRIQPGSGAVGKSLQDLHVRAETGVSVVAVIRNGETVPSPAGDYVFEAGDTAVVVGLPDGIERVTALLDSG